MKIAMLMGRFPILGETFILDQIAALIDLGHDVDIIAGSPSFEEQVHEKVNQYQLQRHTVYTNPPVNLLTRIAKAGRIVLSNICQNGNVIKKVLNVRRYGKRALGLSLLFYVEPFLKKKYDIVHCHFGPVGAQYYFLKELFDLPIIVTFYGYDYSQIPKQKGSSFYEEMFEIVDMVILLNAYSIRKVIDIGCPLEKIRKLPLGIDLNLFKFSDRSLADNQPFKVLTIARFVEKKGLVYAISAIGEVAKRYPIQYDIVGDGDISQKKELEDLVKELGLQNVVSFLGKKTRDQYVEIYRTAHFFLMASHTAKDGDEESQPMVLVEAQATGLPVIATRHAGIPECIVDGKSGFLAVEKSVSSLVEQIDQMIVQSGMWPAMGRQGRAHVEKNFNVIDHACQLESYYHELIESHCLQQKVTHSRK